MWILVYLLITLVHVNSRTRTLVHVLITLEHLNSRTCTYNPRTCKSSKCKKMLTFLKDLLTVQKLFLHILYRFRLPSMSSQIVAVE